MKPGLYIIGTPIGNLGDITFRAAETLGAVDFILAEDTRHSGILLKSLNISKPMISYHKFNEAARVSLIIEKISSGQAAGLVTDAGMPVISDPGSRIVAACRQNNLYVTVIPGPSAVSAALSISGLNSQSYHFEGFLPIKPGRKKRRLEELALFQHPVVIFESPYRCIKLLEIMNEIMQNKRVFIFRELTKINEECVSGTPREILDILRERSETNRGWCVKGELTLIVAEESDVKWL